MNNLEKPAFITNTDWSILKEKYPQKLDEIRKKLNNHYPVQYLIGYVDFYDCYIKVDERVLIPRFETELLIEKVLNRIKKLKINNPKIIDLGCGSGCIAIALAKNLKRIITAIDISHKAISLAKENAILNKVTINFQEADMITFSLQNYDIIISNPPYVRKDETVGPEIKFEPQNAIFANNDGLFYYEKILKNIANNQKQPLLIAFEIGCNQEKSLENIIKKYLPQYDYCIEKDYQNRNRYLFLEKRVPTN